MASSSTQVFKLDCSQNRVDGRSAYQRVVLKNWSAYCGKVSHGTFRGRSPCAHYRRAECASGEVTGCSKRRMAKGQRQFHLGSVGNKGSCGVTIMHQTCESSYRGE